MSTEAHLIGLWHLVSQQTHTKDGRILSVASERPSGILVYDKFGNMAAQALLADNEGSEANDSTASNSYIAYFGTYEVDTDKHIIRHYVIGDANRDNIGTIQVRYYSLRNDELTFTIKDEDGSQHIRIWHRVTAKFST